VLVAYALFLAVLFNAMHKPPEEFGRFMKRVPLPAMLVVPFEPMWNSARGGPLQVGELAPDFDLRTADKTSRVQLSSFRGRKPVVLIFGSYT
jgi:hypothetical protein